jgi:hypothetical protein
LHDMDKGTEYKVHLVGMTPRRDWAIGFKGDKGTTSWINLGISITRRRTCASRAGITPRDDSGYIKIYSTHKGFAAIKADGSIKAWGVSGTGAPSDIGYPVNRCRCGAPKIRMTPRRDWAIGFKGDKGTTSSITTQVFQNFPLYCTIWIRVQSIRFT